jgi:hypothetical protein
MSLGHLNGLTSIISGFTRFQTISYLVSRMGSCPVLSSPSEAAIIEK